MSQPSRLTDKDAESVDSKSGKGRMIQNPTVRGDPEYVNLEDDAEQRTLNPVFRGEDEEKGLYSNECGIPRDIAMIGLEDIESSQVTQRNPPLLMPIGEETSVTSNTERSQSSSTGPLGQRYDGSFLDREEAELLLSLKEGNPTLMETRAGCTLRNLRFVNLSQFSVYRLIDLGDMLEGRGYDMKAAGVELLKGIAVIVAHLNDWKIRRIDHWDSKERKLRLEDGTIISPLQLSISVLGNDQPRSEYLVQELNYQMQVNQLEPISFKELTATYHRLTCCGTTIKELRRGENPQLVLQRLAQKLVNDPDLQFVKRFREHVDPMSFSHLQRQSDAYANIVHQAGGDMRGFYRSWVTKEDLGEVEDGGGELDWQKIKRDPSFKYVSTAATDPRYVKSKRGARIKETIEGSTSAPRTFVPLVAYSDQYETEASLRTRNLSSLQQEILDRPMLQEIDTAFSSLLDIQRALRTFRRDLNTANLI